MTRSLLGALLAVALLVALGVAAQSWLSSHSTAPLVQPPKSATSSTPPPEPTPPVTATVLEVAGSAERFEPETQAWRPLETGSSLKESALLRTHSGSIRITIGFATEVEVSPDSQLRLKKISAARAKVNVESGRISARVDLDSGIKLAVGVLGNDSETVSEGGEFSVLRGPDATLTVASQKGNVTVTSENASVRVREGELSTTATGKPPGAATKIPSSLFVKLQLAGKLKLRTRHTTIRGTTTPGSVVTVNGVEASAANGRFSVSVPLKEGENSVRVVARDVLGRTMRDTVSGIVVDSTPPMLKGKVQW